MNILDILGAAIGMVFVFSEYKANRWLWPSSLLMAAFYTVINFHVGWYANMGICIYNFLISIYGLLVWRGMIQSKEKAERPIASCPGKLWPWLIATSVVLTFVFRWLLAMMGESNMPWLDGLSAALGIVGMWMLSQKYWQQWIFWLISEPILVYIYLSTGYTASAIMYAVYEVFCILGILRWKKESIS